MTAATVRWNALDCGLARRGSAHEECPDFDRASLLIRATDRKNCRCGRAGDPDQTSPAGTSEITQESIPMVCLLVHGHVIFHDGRTGRTTSSQHQEPATPDMPLMDAITHFGVVPHLAQVVDFHIVANGGVRQQTTVHARLHAQLESIANTNRAQVRQTVGGSARGIIKAKALSPTTACSCNVPS